MRYRTLMTSVALFVTACTGPAFAALRLPSILAAVALLIGPALGWILRRRRRHRRPGVHGLRAALHLTALPQGEPRLRGRPVTQSLRRALPDL